MTSVIKVAMSQRICPEYRIPVFKEISKNPEIDFTLYFGDGTTTGSNKNAEVIKGFKHCKLFTISKMFNYNGEKYRAFHPMLPFHIIIGNYDVVITEPGTNIFNNLFIFPLCKIFGIKFIWYTAGNPSSLSLLKKIMMPITKIMMNYSDACITYNSVADSDLLKAGVPQFKIFRAQNTIDSTSIKEKAEEFHETVTDFKKELKINNSKVVLYIGGIEKRKKIINIIKSVGLLNIKGLDVKVLIVGDGPYLEILKNQLSDVESDFTLFVGRKVDDAALYILASDIVVLPGEGGLAINHAFACGRPCIATEAAEGAAVYDYIIDGYNGYVVPQDDIVSLSGKLENVLFNDDLKKQLFYGANATGKKLTIKNMVNSILKAVMYAYKN